MLPKTKDSFLSKKMSGFFNGNVYTYKDDDIYSANIFPSFMRVYLELSRDIDVTMKISKWESIFICLIESSRSGGKRLLKMPESFLTKYIRGVIFHRKIYDRKSLAVIKKLNEEFIFSDYPVKVHISEGEINWICYDFNVDSLLKDIAIKRIGKTSENIAEEVSVSLLYDMRLPALVEQYISKEER